MGNAGFQTNTTKMQELILFVAQESEDDPDFGAVKLNKILFNADYVAYAKRGQSITGEEYQRLDNGPAPRRMLPALEALMEDKAAAIQTRDRFGFTQKRVIALREPDLSGFTGEEIAIVERTIKLMRGMTAAQVSALSHRFSGWKAADPGEAIPYFTVFLSNRPLTERERQRGGELEAEARSALENARRTVRG